MRKFLSTLAALLLMAASAKAQTQPIDVVSTSASAQSIPSWAKQPVDSNAYIGHPYTRHPSSTTSKSEYEEPKSTQCDPITDFPYFNNFNDFATEHDCWISIDNDGDGETWFTGTAAYGSEGWGIDGSYCLISQSYDNGRGEFNADNYLLSPEFELPTTVIESFVLSWYEQSQDPGYPDNYEVMIAPNGSTNINDFVSIYSGTAANPWTKRTVDLTAYLGQTIRVVFHHQSYDCYMLEIDNMSIYEGYAQCEPITEYPYFNNFDNFTAEHDCWIDIDNDGDGQTWFTGTNFWGIDWGIDGSTCLASLSYGIGVGSSGADNYLVSPKFELPILTTDSIYFSWYEMSEDPGYPDNYEVMIAPNGSTNINDFVSIYSGTAVDSWTARVANLSAYSGQIIRVVFHHKPGRGHLLKIDNMVIDVLGGSNNGINDINGNEFTVYPNPVKNTLNINGVEPGTEIRIYNDTGSEVMNFDYEGQNINVESLTNGVYILRIGSSTIKFVK